jgi:hypothetical protein
MHIWFDNENYDFDNGTYDLVMCWGFFKKQGKYVWRMMSHFSSLLKSNEKLTIQVFWTEQNNENTFFVYCFVFNFFFFVTQAHHIVQASFKCVILLLLPPKCLNYRCVPLCLTDMKTCLKKKVKKGREG